MSVAAIVLAGGRARRLGTPKHAVSLGGKTLLDRSLDAVTLLPTVVVGPEALLPELPARPSVSLIQERPAFSGPAAGIGAALDELDRRGVATGTCLVLSCDLVRPAAVVELLLSAAEEFTDGLVLRDASGRTQWLSGLYAVDALRGAVSRLRSSASLDSAPVRALFGSLALTLLDDPGELSADIDTPADLVAAKERILPAVVTPSLRGVGGVRRSDAPLVELVGAG
ncbi:molybdenum cofactor guanylyltransferase [Leifsonia sp. SIMBA_070]|uniref:molybdenum cofactor guanylyltransferase n=1 Tax=Leifsonia sp. SIMBA_070 TaxID=3085810 RepID=UPI00397D268F